MNIAIVAIACVVIFFLLPLLCWFMAKTKWPNRELKPTRSGVPPNPPSSQPTIKRPRQEEGTSTRKPSKSKVKGKGKAHDIPHMPNSDPLKVVYQIEFERHDIPVSISVYTIREFFSLPHIENPQFPFHPSVEIRTDNILSVLMGAAHKWDHLRKISTDFLLPDYRVLYAIYHHCIRQDTHHSEFNSFDSLQLYAIGIGLFIDLGNLIFEGIVACLVSHHDGMGSYNALVMGSLITYILIHFYKVPHYKKEIAVKPSKGTYNIGSWHRSLSQAPIYVRAKNDADDRFLQMKARELTGSKGKIIQGSSCRTAPPPTTSEDVQGQFALMKKIMKKVEKIGKHLNIPHFDSDDNIEVPVPPSAAPIVEEGEEEVEDSESEGNEDVSSNDS
ncbi:hypothetical protein LguiB_008774 [Lonicera macranthoides]